MSARSSQPASRSFIALCFLILAAAIISSCSLTSQGVSTPSNRYALVIGISKYCPNYAEGIYPNLSYCDDDANSIAALLGNQGWNVKYKLVNTDATYETIKADIASFSTIIGGDTNASILVYYSGHGSIDDAGTPYIIPQNGIIDLGTSYTYNNIIYPNTQNDLSKWITPATLSSWMEAVPAKNRVLILDSCYSGGFVKDANSVDTSPADYSQALGTTAETGVLLAALSDFNNLVATNLASLGGRDLVALSAAGSNEVSWDDGSSGHGAFTNYLLKAAASGDSDGDGYVTVAEAYAYAKTNIKANWNPQYKYYYGSTRNEWDFLPHISGGTGDIALYAP
ncbi:caspase family protein [bacterium]|nr:caspase family protein [bacterium]